MVHIILFILLSSACTLKGGQANPRSSPASQGAEYVLGPEDEIELQVEDSDQFLNRRFRIGGAGEVTLPLAGTVTAGGLTAKQLEAAVKDRLRSYIKNPDVIVILK